MPEAAARRPPSTPRRHRPRLLGVAIGGALALLASASPALGHAQVVSIDPADGERLTVAPSAVSITFNEPVGLGPEGLRVLDGSGQVVDAGPEVVEGATVRQPLEPLGTGWYLVSWGIVSEDGHIVGGSSVFAVGDVDAAARPVTASIDPAALLDGCLQGLADLGLVVATGAFAALWLLRAATGRVRRLAVFSAVVAAAATSAWALVSVIEGGSTWIATPFAVAALPRLLLVLFAIAAARRRPDLAALAMVVALCTLAIGGHATGSIAAAILISVHLVAGALWLGAAPAVALVLWDPSTPDADALTVIRRFSRVAGFALAVVIVAGALSALILTDLFAAGVLTTYGVILGAKSGLVGLAALGGALGRRSLGREPERRRYQRLFMLDSALLVGVVVLSAGLSLVGPHEGHAGHVASARCAATVGGASTAVVLTPGRAGPNGALVSGVAHTVEGVTLDLAHERTGEAPLQVPLAHATDGWAGTAVLPLAGEWQATVVVRVDTFTEARGSCTLTVTP